jgi:hypothetical protein
MMAEIPELSSLPGNWGRKLVRSAQNSLSGRFKDAGLGHWVRGRHPWTSTSVFPAASFKHDWLKMQEDLEKELGFELLNIETLIELPKPNYLLPKKNQEKSEKLHKKYSEKEIMDLLSKPKYRDYLKITLESSSSASSAPSSESKQVALELGCLKISIFQRSPKSTVKSFVIKRASPSMLKYHAVGFRKTGWYRNMSLDHGVI